MKINDYSDRVFDLIGDVMFPRTERTLRRRDARFLVLSLVLGVAICAAFGCILFTVNTQGRI